MDQRDICTDSLVFRSAGGCCLSMVPWYRCRSLFVKSLVYNESNVVKKLLRPSYTSPGLLLTVSRRLIQMLVNASLSHSQSNYSDNKKTLGQELKQKKLTAFKKQSFALIVRYQEVSNKRVNVVLPTRPLSHNFWSPIKACFFSWIINVRVYRNILYYHIAHDFRYSCTHSEISAIGSLDWTTGGP